MAGRSKKTLLFSPAKLNLGLWIVGRRKDGFHRLESLFWPLDLGDDVEVEAHAREPGVHLEWAGDAAVRAELPPESENIVSKLRAAFPGVLADDTAVRIRKRIPLGGGLGGGSSNAGTLLAHFAKEEEDLESRAAALGADVPFFLDPRPAWVTGIGENRRALRFSREALQGIHFLLVFLPRPTPTPLVFRALRESKFSFSSSANPFPAPRVERSAFFNFLGWAKNDLEPFAARHYPLIREVVSRLRKTPCIFAGMSGSGSTCFAVFGDAAAREKTAKELMPFFREIGCTSLSAGTLTHK